MSVDIWGVKIKTSRGDVDVNVHDRFSDMLMVQVSKELIDGSDPDELATIIAKAMNAVQTARAKLAITSVGVITPPMGDHHA